MFSLSGMQLHRKRQSQMMQFHVAIIGGGLAGTEAAYQLARRNISVTLYEIASKCKNRDS
jgi:flavin-dependent dehydrogenase